MLATVGVESDKSIIKNAAKVLSRCGLIVYPTDTLYGIGADATRKECVDKVFKLKQRCKDVSISVLVSDFEMLGEYARLDERQWRLVRKLLPGKVSVVLDSTGRLAPNLSSSGSIAFRIPFHPLCTSIVKAFGKPITTTSANISGRVVSATVGPIAKQFGDKVELYIDAGKLPLGPSTVVDLRKKPKILREGAELAKVKAVITPKV